VRQLPRNTLTERYPVQAPTVVICKISVNNRGPRKPPFKTIQRSLLRLGRLPEQFLNYGRLTRGLIYAQLALVVNDYMGKGVGRLIQHIIASATSVSPRSLTDIVLSDDPTQLRLPLWLTDCLPLNPPPLVEALVILTHWKATSSGE